MHLSHKVNSKIKNKICLRFLNIYTTVQKWNTGLKWVEISITNILKFEINSKQ